MSENTSSTADVDDDTDVQDDTDTAQVPGPRPVRRVGLGSAAPLSTSSSDASVGSDDLQATERQWAAAQVASGDLSVAEAEDLVPGTARLREVNPAAEEEVSYFGAGAGADVDLVGFGETSPESVLMDEDVDQDGQPSPWLEWSLAAEAVAGSEPGAGSAEWFDWFATVMDRSPVHRAFEESTIEATFPQYRALWDRHHEVQQLLAGGRIDASEVISLSDEVGGGIWYGLAGQDDLLLRHLDYTANQQAPAADCDDL